MLEVGDLPLLGRKALEPKLERLASALRLRERALAPAPLADTAQRNARTAAQQSAGTRAAQAADQTPRPLPHTPVTADTPEAAGRDGAQLRNVQIELRALRAEIYQLSRALGFTSRDSNRTEYRGVLQLRDNLDSDTRLRRWQADDNANQAALQAMQRRSEAQRVSARQRELLRALQRAENRLAQAPRDLQPGLRDGIIGEIYRARYSIALFGGVNGTAQLAGMEYDTSA